MHACIIIIIVRYGSVSSKTTFALGVSFFFRLDVVPYNVMPVYSLLLLA